MGATGIVAVVFLTLGQTFSDGVTSYGQKDYVKATESFTSVLKTATPESPYRTVALLWRARTFASAGKSVAAEHDLDRLLTGTLDAVTQNDAEALYRDVTGMNWIGSGLVSPEKSWSTVVERINAKDARFLPRCFTGPMLETVTSELARDDAWSELMHVAQMTLLHVDIDESLAKATVLLEDAQEDTLALVAVKKGRFWLFFDQAADPPRREAADVTPRRGVAATNASDVQKLNTIRHLIEQFVMDEHRMPPTLEALRKYDPEFDTLSVSSVDREPFLLRAPTAKVELPASPWVFSEKAANGKRALLAFGQVRLIEDEAFVRMAIEHGVHWLDVPVDELEDAEARQMSEWIDALGSEAFDTRTGAYRNLKAAGARARESLEAARDNEDPEIAYQVKALLDAL